MLILLLNTNAMFFASQFVIHLITDFHSQDDLNQISNECNMKHVRCFIYADLGDRGNM